MIRRVEGRSRSEIQNCGCDQEGRKLVGKLELKRVLRCFLKDVTEGLFLIWKGKMFQRTRGIVTERIGEKFD